MSNELVSLGVALVIIWQGYILIKKQREMKQKLEDIKRANEDLNIEFGSIDGIELVKKNYPDLELKDDRRTGLEDANES